MSYLIIGGSGRTGRLVADLLVTGTRLSSLAAVLAPAESAWIWLAARAKTFELYDGGNHADWPALFARLRADSPAV